MTDTMDRAEWLEHRRSGIGASDVAALLGISPWASPWSVWADKVALLPLDDDVDDDDPREFGRRAERMVGPWFEDRTGLALTAHQASLERAPKSHHMATLDGLVLEQNPCTASGDCPIPSHPEGLHSPDWHTTLDDLGYLLRLALGTGEIKTDFGSTWAHIPAHYQAQGQWQMHVTDLERVWFAVLHGRRFRTYILDRDQADIDLMVDRVDEFWHDHVMAGIPPAVDDSEATAKAIAAVYPEDDKTSIDVDAGVVDQLVELLRAKSDEKAAKARALGITNQIKAHAGDAYELTHDGRKVATVATQTRSTSCDHCGHGETSAPFRVLRPSTAVKKKASDNQKDTAE